MAQYQRRRFGESIDKAYNEGLKGVATDAAKLYAAGDVEAKVEHHLKGNDPPPPGPGGDPGTTEELKREARERAREERELGVTRMYQDNARAPRPRRMWAARVRTTASSGTSGEAAAAPTPTHPELSVARPIKPTPQKDA